MENIPEFEYDPVKSGSNRVKHGLDFAAAQALWNDIMAIEVRSSHANEPRFLRIGQIDGKIWTAACTNCSGKIRIISARRARQKEERAYFAAREQAPHNHDRRI
jgi:uncharacterized DUF497 family protein